MQAYQLGSQKFEGADTQVFGVSTDNVYSLKAFAEKLTLSFPLLSDFKDRKVGEAYGIMIPKMGMANRVTFVIDKQGKIEFMEQGAAAMDILGAGDACSRLAHKAAK